jgi:hypothetical protein
MQGNFNQLVDKITALSGLEKSEVERRIEAKKAKFSGLISQEGACQIVAAELGINFDKEKVKINELIQGLKKANVVGKIIQVFPIREYNKNGRQGKVLNLILADETGNIRIVLWDTNHISLFESGKIKKEDIIEISNGMIRGNELHLSGLSDIKISNEVLENVKTERQSFEKKINEFKQGEQVKTRAFVVQAFEPKFFYVCPECGKRALQDANGSRCESHGKILPNKRALLSIVIDDGSESIRAVLFSEQIDKLGISMEDMEKTENFLGKRENLLGKEAFFQGGVRQNKLFGTNEFFISGIEEISIDKLIESLEKS